MITFVLQTIENCAFKSLLAHFLNILVKELGFQILSKESGEAAVLASAESGFLQCVVYEDLDGEFLVCGLGQVVFDNDGGGGGEREGRGVAADETLRN